MFERIGIVAAVAVGSVDSFASVFVLALQGYDIQKLEDQIFGAVDDYVVLVLKVLKENRVS